MMFISNAFLLLSILIQGVTNQPALNVEQSEGSRIEFVGPTGTQRMNFTWIRTTDTSSWIQAARHCQDDGGSLPRASEMRYFYKTLRSDNALLPNRKEVDNHTSYGVNFYLADILEATMDYPNTESGERMCLVVEKRPNAHVNLAETSAIRSCLTPVNLLVCRFLVDSIGGRSDSFGQFDEIGSRGSAVVCDTKYGDSPDTGLQPNWIIELKKRAEYQDHHVCFKPPVFYIVAVSCGLVLILTLITSSVLAIRHHRIIRRLKRGKPRDDYLLGPPSTIGSELETGPTGGSAAEHPLDTAGSMDILADSAFYRAPGSGPRESYKQAIIQDGYQKLTNGLGTSGRSSVRPNRDNGTTWISSARGGASFRRSQNRGVPYDAAVN